MCERALSIAEVNQRIRLDDLDVVNDICAITWWLMMIMIMKKKMFCDVIEITCSWNAPLTRATDKRILLTIHLFQCIAKISNSLNICKWVSRLDYVISLEGNGAISISSHCCALPYTLNGTLYYNCTVYPAFGDDFGCYYRNRQWVTCAEPAGMLLLVLVGYINQFCVGCL